ncbi:MAG: leucine-rich repeat domain-containing protein [Clostridia bacterium]|nr:leucine-rich repeat domain-containing protein [Clostridia bacterium]
MKCKKIPYLIVLILVFACLLCIGGCGMGGEPEYALLSTGNVSADGTFTYNVYENRTAVITGGTANDVCLTIPAMIDGYPVVEIGDDAFAGNTSIGYLVLGENVRKISFAAFNGCQALIRVDATPALRVVGSGAFGGCTALCEIVGATKLESIDESAFFQCTSLIKAPLPETLRTVGSQAFYGCSSLTEIALPAKIESLGDGVFGFCESLCRVDLGGLTYLPENTFQRCTSLCKIEIGKSVTAIGESAFRGCFALSEITGAKNVSNVGYCVFEETAWLDEQTDEFVLFGKGILLRYNGSSTEVTVPRGVSMIAEAFCDNDTVKSITVPAGVTKIGSAAFSGCGQLSRVVLGKNVTEIADTAFASCSALSYVYLPKSLTYIGNSAFNGCLLLSTVSYGGSARDWAKITVENGNTPLALAELATGKKA